MGICLFIVPCLTDFQTNYKLLYESGHWLIIVTSIILVVNITALLIDTVKGAKQKIKIILHKYRKSAKIQQDTTITPSS